MLPGMKSRAFIAFRVDEGRLQPMLLPAECATDFDLCDLDLTDSPVTDRAVRQAMRRLMALTHGLSDPGDDHDEANADAT